MVTLPNLQHVLRLIQTYVRAVCNTFQKSQLMPLYRDMYITLTFHQSLVKNQNLSDIPTTLLSKLQNLVQASTLLKTLVQQPAHNSVQIMHSISSTLKRHGVRRVRHVEKLKFALPNFPPQDAFHKVRVGPLSIMGMTSV